MNPITKEMLREINSLLHIKPQTQQHATWLSSAITNIFCLITNDKTINISHLANLVENWIQTYEDYQKTPTLIMGLSAYIETGHKEVIIRIPILNPEELKQKILKGNRYR